MGGVWKWGEELSPRFFSLPFFYLFIYFIQFYIYIYIYIYICVCVCVCVYVCVCVCVCLSDLCIGHNSTESNTKIWLSFSSFMKSGCVLVILSGRDLELFDWLYYIHIPIYRHLCTYSYILAYTHIHTYIYVCIYLYIYRERDYHL